MATCTLCSHGNGFEHQLERGRRDRVFHKQQALISRMIIVHLHGTSVVGAHTPSAEPEGDEKRRKKRKIRPTTETSRSRLGQSVNNRSFANDC
eukprot:3647039-Prymnesium_polylepis.1